LVSESPAEVAEKKRLKTADSEKQANTPPKSIEITPKKPSTVKKQAAKVRRKLKNDMTAATEHIKRLKTALTYANKKGPQLRKIKHELEYWKRRIMTLSFQYKAGVTHNVRPFIRNLREKREAKIVRL